MFKKYLFYELLPPPPRGGGGGLGKKHKNLVVEQLRIGDRPPDPLGLFCSFLFSFFRQFSLGDKSVFFLSGSGG